MRVEVKVPQLPESVAEATLVSWHKKSGDAVRRDENLIDIETDKVVLELPSPADGVLVEVLKGDGTTVTSNDVIAVLDTDGKAGAATVTSDGASAGAAQSPSAAATTREAPPGTRAAKQQPAPAPAKPVPSSASYDTPSTKTPPPPQALPAARKLMAEAPVVPADITGTGRGGRITKGDVQTALEAKSAPSAPTAPATPSPAPQPAARAPAVNIATGSRPEQRVPMSRLRQRVAERLVQSQSTAAILTTFNEANMQPVMDLRNRYKERFEKDHGVKLGFMGFFVKAAVHALKKFPLVNASIDGNDIVYHGYYDIGIAVGSPRGLVVPIIRDADLKSIAEIEREIADFGKRAQDGKLTVEELTGGTYTISNGGVFGSMLSTPIINPPQSAILGVHATKERPVVENGQIVVRPINFLAQSYDHRIIDGREAVLSLVAIKEALEDPARMLLDL
ncbi:MAG TPA: 2-oxoglutarate dehydrogenase complex dihydrolipoyllysine-residue succinyltransferase [Casimicrobiaceae bacterium]|nr:2-oxoglutarate dehydrogenase complex dihydrolipoyllysine-residue succinyltransferase [Casimicrobiaceae bacterium]